LAHNGAPALVHSNVRELVGRRQGVRREGHGRIGRSVALGLAVLGLAVLGLGLGAAPAEAAAPASKSAQSAAAARQAKAKFEQGLALSDDGKWTEALVAFRESNDLAPSAVVQHNIAVTLQSLGKYVEARRSIDATLQDIADRKLVLKQPALKTELKKLRETVSAKTVMVSLVLDPSSAEVEIDGSEPERLPDGRVELDPGRHLFVVAAPGRQTTTVTRTLESGEVEIELRAPPTPPPTPAKAEEPDTAWYESGWFWGVSSGVVVAGVAVAVIAVVLQPKEQSTAEPPGSTYGQVLPAGVRF